MTFHFLKSNKIIFLTRKPMVLKNKSVGGRVGMKWRLIVIHRKIVFPPNYLFGVSLDSSTSPVRDTAPSKS